MIRINLLPAQKARKIRKRLEVRSRVIFITLFFSFEVLLFAVLWLRYDWTITRLEAEKTQKSAEMERLAALVKEVENLEQLKKSVQQKIGVIERLRKNQGGPVHLLDEVSRSLPDRVWLTSLAHRGGNVDLEGKALTNSEIVEFVDNLKHSPYFRDIQLLESHKASEGVVPIYIFRLKWGMAL